VPQHPPIPSRDLQASLLALLRGLPPGGDHAPEEIAAALRRYECGGYLHRLWSGRTGGLPAAWAAALAAAHRRTQVDSLAALAQFRALGDLLRALGVPFLLLKGAAYLTDLYPDPGTRAVTDIDLLVPPGAAPGVARQLRAAGYRTGVDLHYPESRRFEAWRPGPAECRFEFHWELGLPFRFRVDTAGIWERAAPCSLEGIACGRPAPEDALLYHVAHLADHYFGPSLKWVIDLREMLARWPLEPRVLRERAAAWRVATALGMVLPHLERLFPGCLPEALAAAAALGPLRRRLFARYRATGPLELLSVPPEGPRRAPLRLLMIDRPLDALGLAVTVLLRPVRRLVGADGAAPPWDWRD
jgi:hypothetical protein